MQKEKQGKRQKTKVLYVITKSNWGGAQRYVFDLATGLPPEKFEVVVALGGGGPLKTELEKSGIRTIPLPFLVRDVSVFLDTRVFFGLWSLFRKERPDVVHLNSSKIGGLGALAGRISRTSNIIFTAHGWAFREEWRSPLQRIIIKFLSWLTILWSHSIITVSERDFREGRSMPFTQKKFVLVYNGLSDLPPFSKEEMRKKISETLQKNIPTDTSWIGTIGELHKNKGHAYAIEALAQISLKHNVAFFLIGEGEERGALEKLIEKLEMGSKIFLLGKKDDAATLLEAFDFFLFPSIKEGLPYAILEAGRAGLPVVASAVGGVPEIITDMNSGILVRPKSPEEIVKAFEYLFAHKKEAAAFGKKLHANVKKNFSIKKMLRETLVVYTPKNIHRSIQK